MSSPGLDLTRNHYKAQAVIMKTASCISMATFLDLAVGDRTLSAGRCTYAM